MLRPIFIYIIGSLLVAISAGMSAGWKVAAWALATSTFAFVAGSGLKAALWWGDKSQKIAGTFIAATLMATAQWTSTGFSVQLSGNGLSGASWAWIGFVVCFVFTNRQMARNISN
jgi:hypothetical protein